MNAHSSATEAASEQAGESVTGTLATGNKGSKECHGAENGEVSQVLGFSGELATVEKVEGDRQDPGCPTAKLDPLRADFVTVFCEALTLHLWLQEIPRRKRTRIAPHISSTC